MDNNQAMQAQQQAQQAQGSGILEAGEFVEFVHDIGSGISSLSSNSSDITEVADTATGFLETCGTIATGAFEVGCAVVGGVGKCVSAVGEVLEIFDF